MSTLRRLFHLGLWGPRVREGVEWELAHHFEERIEELIAAGHTPAEAREMALRAFGDVERVRRELVDLDTRGERRLGMARLIDDLWQDVRYGVRAIRLRPGLAAGIVLTLALGIGANAALFSVADALLLRPLPYGTPGELATLYTSTPQRELDRPYIGVPIARGFREAYPGAAMLHARSSPRYTGGIEARTLAVQAVTAEFNELFGVQPLLGRALLPEDESAAAPPVALLDYNFWRSMLGGETRALGSAILLNGIPHTVIGVMPPGFRFPTYATTDAWIALREDDSVLGTVRRGSWVEVVARVPGAHFAAANEHVSALGSALYRADEADSDRSLRLRPMDEERKSYDELNRAMLLLGGAVFTILLVAGVNMVSLLLARGAARSEELAIRVAIGAARGRIIRQIATEAMLLALAGGVVAVFVALLVVRAMHGIMPGSVTFFAPYDIAVEQRTLVFTFLVAVASGLVFGMLPAVSASRWARPAARGGLSRYGGQTTSKRRMRRGLVVAEVCFSVMLLITAALLINSFTRLMRVDPGMRLDGMAVATFDVSATAYPDAAQRGAYLRRLEERIAALPGVEGATISGGLPPRAGGLRFGIVFEPEGSEAPPPSEGRVVPMTSVAPNFFEVTGARLLRGRAFTLGDGRESGHVIIDEALARHLWPDGNAVGRRFRMAAGDDWLTVIGVTAELRLLGPDERRGEFAILTPLGNYDGASGQLTMGIRTRGDPRHELRAIRNAIRDVDADQPVIDLMPATTYYALAADMPRFLALLTGVLAALAVALTAVGIHGVLAFGVAQRRHEIGVRMVLGARAASIGRAVVAEGVVLAGIGLALGIAGALLGARIVEGALYGLGAVDPPTYAVAAAVVLLVALAATLRPARSATATDPMSVMKGQ